MVPSPRPEFTEEGNVQNAPVLPSDRDFPLPVQQVARPTSPSSSTLPLVPSSSDWHTPTRQASASQPLLPFPLSLDASSLDRPMMPATQDDDVIISRTLPPPPPSLSSLSNQDWSHSSPAGCSNVRNTRFESESRPYKSQVVPSMIDPLEVLPPMATTPQAGTVEDENEEDGHELFITPRMTATYSDKDQDAEE